MDTLRTLLYGVSAQRPSHSLFIGGQQLPLEARMGGIFLGFLCGFGLLAVLGRLQAGRSLSGWLGAACWVLLALTAADGLNAFLFDGNLPHLYAPTTAARLLTGLGAGLGLAWLALPVAAGVIWPRPLDEPVIDDGVEFGAGLMILALLAGLMLLGPDLLAWPIALAMLASVLLAFGIANAYLLTLASPRARGRAGVAISSLGLGLIELAALSALRSWLAGLGITWGV